MFWWNPTGWRWRCWACNFFGRPAEHMTMIGITGTNGKTSSTLLLKQVLSKPVWGRRWG